MGLLSKLHLKKKDKDKAGKEDGHKKHKHAHSQDAVRPQHDTTRRQAPQLIVADAPNRPAFGGKGLQGDTTYDIQRQHDHDKRDHKDARQPHDKPAHSAPAHKPEPIRMPRLVGITLTFDMTLSSANPYSWQSCPARRVLSLTCLSALT